MGIFYVDVTVRHIASRDKSAIVPQMLVDTGSEATWVPRTTLESLGIREEKKGRSYMMANGQTISRSIGYAIVEVAPDFTTIDEVVFAEPGDLPLLGARSLEGLNVRVDPEGKKLVAAGPQLAASRIRVN